MEYLLPDNCEQIVYMRWNTCVQTNYYHKQLKEYNEKLQWNIENVVIVQVKSALMVIQGRTFTTIFSMQVSFGDKKVEIWFKKSYWSLWKVLLFHNIFIRKIKSKKSSVSGYPYGDLNLDYYDFYDTFVNESNFSIK